MAYFSFKTGTPIAKIKGGSDEGQIIYVDMEKDMDQCCDDCSPECKYSRNKCCKKCKGGCFEEDNDDICDDDEYNELFGAELKKLKKGEFPYIQLKSGEMQPLPYKIIGDELKRENVYVSGPEGAGKSYYAANYIKEYLKMYPGAHFFIFSGVTKDPPLDALKPRRVKMDQRMVDKPISVDEFPNNAIVLFDDIDTLEDKKVKNEVIKLRDRLLEKGRHKNIFVVSLTHNPTAGKDTKTSLAEASSIVLFPQGGDTFHITRVLKEYLGYDPKTIKEILKIKSRWIQCSKRYPKYIVHSKGCFFPN